MTTIKVGQEWAEVDGPRVIRIEWVWNVAARVSVAPVSGGRRTSMKTERLVRKYRLVKDVP